MKKLFIIISLFCSFAASAQVYQNDPSYGRSIDRYEVRKDLGIPPSCGVPEVNSTVTNKPKIAYDTCNRVFYIFDPSTQTWNPLTGSTSVLQDGRISGAEVTWTGDSTAFFVPSGTFRKFGEFYTTRDTTIILDRPNDLYGRIDLIVFDTSNGGQIRKVTGELSPTPIEPSLADYQIKLTTGIAFSAGATTPSNVSVSLIYDENTEWTAGHTGTMTVNFNNTSTVYHGSKSAAVSGYAKNSALTFTGTTQTVTDAVLSFWINLSAAYSKSFTLQFWNGSTAASNPLTITNSFGLNPSKTGYQNVAIPLKSSFSWTSQTFDKLTIMMTGGGNFSGLPAFNLDYITLQNGGTTIPPTTDNSNKVDSTSTKKINDSTYVNLYWIKGLSYQKGDTVKIPTTDTAVVKVHYPLISYNGDSLTVAVDSMPQLEYAAAGRDTTLWNERTLIDKGYLEARIAAFVTSGGNDSAYVAVEQSPDSSYILFLHSNRAIAPDTLSVVGGSVNSVTGNPSALVDNTDPKNPVIKSDITKLSRADSNLYVTPTALNATIPPIDTIPLLVFGGGGANTTDTASFTTSSIYGAIYLSLSDTFVITKMMIGLQGTSPSIVVKVYWNDSLGITAGATPLTASGTTATNIYTGTSVTTFANNKIPPNNFIWCSTPTITTKPTMMTVTLIGYKSRTK